MNKKLVAVLSLVTLMMLPVATFAIPETPVPDVRPGLDAWGIVNIILDFIWPIFIGFAVLMFIVAGFYFLTARGDPSGVATARQMVLWGVVGVAVGVIAFSLPYIIKNTLGF